LVKLFLDEVLSKLGSVPAIRSLANHYNCAGMVFASRRAWISSMEFISEILKDDGYTLVDRKDVRYGDVVLYRDEDGEYSHVGLIADRALLIPGNEVAVEKELLVLSQWGGAGEFLHGISEVPKYLGYGDPTEFWTDRMTL